MVINITFGRVACDRSVEPACSFVCGVFAGALCAGAARPIATVIKSASEKAKKRASMRLLWRQLLGATFFLVCVGGESFCGQGFGQRFMHDGVFGCQLNSAPQLRNRIVDFVLVDQGLPERAMSSSEIGIDRNGLPEDICRLVELIFLQESHSEIEGGFKIGGIQLKSLL